MTEEKLSEIEERFDDLDVRSLIFEVRRLNIIEGIALESGISFIIPDTYQHSHWRH
jgi:hypothetical protein